MNTLYNYTYVSVIIPVFNGGNKIIKTVEALLAQEYPAEFYEIIVVDNGSTDSTYARLSTYPIILLSEEMRGSYAARNKGILCARGDVLAFTDSDCIPDPYWIRKGVEFLEYNKAAVGGGHVAFTFSELPTPAEYVDAIININNQDSISRHGMAATANLFSRKHVFDEIGMFNANLQSGGDGEWSERVRAGGLQMYYIPEAIVRHPARRFFELIKKHIRVGSGSNTIWKTRGKGLLWRISAWIYLCLPVYAFQLPRMIKRYGSNDVRYPVVHMMLVAYVVKLATAWGILVQALRKKVV